MVKRGTGSKLYSKDFSMAGKTGTAQVDYGKDGGSIPMLRLCGTFRQITLFSCIVVVHKPSTVNNNYYGADVAGF
jgi:cell division protein FtsI (penicillin-binding protein 3)